MALMVWFSIFSTARTHTVAIKRNVIIPRRLRPHAATSSYSGEGGGIGGGVSIKKAAPGMQARRSRQEELQRDLQPDQDAARAGVFLDWKLVSEERREAIHARAGLLKLDERDGPPSVVFEGGFQVHARAQLNLMQGIVITDADRLGMHVPEKLFKSGHGLDMHGVFVQRNLQA